MIYQKKEKRKRDKGTITIERKEVSNKDHFRYLGLTISKEGDLEDDARKQQLDN